MMTGKRVWVEGEPTLDELLSDPIVDFILRRDRLTREDIWEAVTRARENLGLGNAVPERAA